MTDRHVAYLVLLDKPVREDDAENTTLNAIKMIKGIVRVVPQIGSIQHQMATEQAKHELTAKLFKVLEDS